MTCPLAVFATSSGKKPSVKESGTGWGISELVALGSVWSEGEPAGLDSKLPRIRFKAAGERIGTAGGGFADFTRGLGLTWM